MYSKFYDWSLCFFLIIIIILLTYILQIFFFYCDFYHTYTKLLQKFQHDGLKMLAISYKLYFLSVGNVNLIYLSSIIVYKLN